MFSKKYLSLYLISLVIFIDIMGIGLVYPMFASMLYQGDCQMLPPDTSEAARGACLGILLAMMPITQFFSAPILGMLSDQIGRRRVLIPSLAVGVFGYLLAVVAVGLESFVLLLVSRIAVGISAGTAAVVSAALADISTPEDKAKNFGFFNMAGGLGFTAGPFMGGVLSSYSLGFIEGYALPFAVASCVSLFNLTLIWKFFEDAYVPNKVHKLNFTMGLQNIVKAFNSPNLRVIFLSVFLACVGWSFYWEFAPVTWISSYSFDTPTIGNCYAYGAAVYALSCGLLIRPLVSRYSNQHLLCFALLMLFVVIGALAFHSNPMWLWIYIPLQQFAIALFWPTAAAYVSNSVGEDVQGEILGVLQSVDSLAFSVSPIIAGPLLALTPLMPIFIGALCNLAAGIILAVYLVRSVKKLKLSPTGE